MPFRFRAAVVSLVLSLPGLAGAGPAQAREISGTHDFSGDVVVPKGETWRVLPGAEVRFRGGRWVVRGRLLVEGTETRPARVAGDEAFEGIDVRGEAGARLSHAVVSGGRRGVQLTGSTAEFRNVRFQGNAIGLDVGQYARADIGACAFEGNGRVGLLVKRGGSAAVKGTGFSGAGKAGVYVHGADNVAVRDCRFEGNEAGVLAGTSGARVRVERSVFRGNATGIVAEKMATPAVSECEVAGNGTGFLFTRRAEGTVSGCRIEGNGTGVLVEFSSYPVFRGNAFRGNREMAVRLRHQSSEWEGEATDADRDGFAGAGAFGRGGEPRGDFRPKGTPGADPPGGIGIPRKAGLDGTVDFRGNDWGEMAEPVARGGDVAGIHDGRDEPYFEYRGKRYRMDVVLLK
jgi:parallel beta-helix repeat protein